jgi:hypothetical protein
MIENIQKVKSGKRFIISGLILMGIVAVGTMSVPVNTESTDTNNTVPAASFNPPYDFTPWVSDYNGRTDLPYILHGFKDAGGSEALFQSHVGTDQRIYVRRTTVSDIISDPANPSKWTGWQTSSDPYEFTNKPTAFASLDNDIFQAHVGWDNKIYTKKTSYTDFATNGPVGAWKRGSDPYEKTSFPVSMISFKGQLFQAHVGENNRIYTRSSSDNGDSWGAWITSTDPYEYTNKALAFGATSDKLWQAHIGGNDRIYVRTSLDGIGWSAWITSSDPYEFTKLPVAMASSGEIMFISHVGGDNRIYTSDCIDFGNCTGWTQNGGSTMKSVTLTEYDGFIHQGHVGTDNVMYWRRSDIVVIPPVK